MTPVSRTKINRGDPADQISRPWAVGHARSDGVVAFLQVEKEHRMPKSTHTVEGPKHRKPCDLSSWNRIVGSDGETVGYTPDGATAKEFAASPAIKDALEFLANEITAAQVTYRKLARRMVPAHVIHERLNP